MPTLTHIRLTVLAALGAFAGAIPATGTANPPSVLNSTLDVQDNDASYIVRVGISENSPISARLESSSLLLDTGLIPSNTRLEQRVFLPQARADAPLEIRRDAAQLVITVPKGTPAFPSSTPPLPTQDSLGVSFDSLRDQLLSQAAAMLKQASNPAATQGTPHQDIFNSLLGAIAPQTLPPASNSFQLEEGLDKYILSASLSEDQARNISVNVDNDRFVTITLRHQQNVGASEAAGFTSGTSAQALTLPGPVKGDQITITHQNGRLLVTLPKAP